MCAADDKFDGPTSGPPHLPSALWGVLLLIFRQASYLVPSFLRYLLRFLPTIFKGLDVLPKMSLVIKNLQRVVPIRRVPLRSRMDVVRSILGVKDFDLGIICVDNKRIQHINRIYRKKNVPTDVLSFPFHENLQAGEFPQPHSPDDYNLGDVFLGVEYIFQQCRENEDFYDILTVTATHGLCHLLGFTHNSEVEWQKMYNQEKLVLEELNRCTGANLQPLTKGLY